MRANQQIRQAAKSSGVKLWQVAAAYGITDGNFSRKLRVELPEPEQQKIVGIIQRLAKEGQS